MVPVCVKYAGLLVAIVVNVPVVGDLVYMTGVVVDPVAMIIGRDWYHERRSREYLVSVDDDVRLMVVCAGVACADPVDERSLIWKASEVWEVPILDEPVEKKERVPMFVTPGAG